MDRKDYQRFLRLLAGTLARFQVLCRAYCLMPNHFHLLLEPAEQPLSRMMQQLNSAYGQSFNRRHERVGHVFQGRFKAFLVDGHAYLLRVARYIVLNPVRAQMVKQPDEWPWSSYRATAGIAATPPALLAPETIWQAFETDDVGQAQERFVCFAREIAPPLARGPLIGSADFAKNLDEMLSGHRPNRELTYAERFAARPSLERLLGTVPVHRVTASALREAFVTHAYTLGQIADFLSLHPSTVWRRIRRDALGLVQRTPGRPRRAQRSRSDPAGHVEHATIKI